MAKYCQISSHWVTAFAREVRTVSTGHAKSQEEGFLIGPILASFIHFHSFHNPITKSISFNYINWKSLDILLEIRTWGHWMVGAEGSTVLWRPPNTAREFGSCLKKPFLASYFLYFWSFQQLTVDMFIVNFCQILNLNHRPLVSEATSLPAEPQPLPQRGSFFNCQEEKEEDEEEGIISWVECVKSKALTCSPSSPSSCRDRLLCSWAKDG